MNIEFKICKHGTCGLSVTGLEQEGQYYTDFPKDLGQFSYAGTVTLNIIVPVDSNNIEDYNKLEYQINNHSDDSDISIFQFKQDGLFKIVHVILPTLTEFNQLDNSVRKLYDNEIIYLYNKEQIYKKVLGGDLQLVPIEEIVESENLKQLYKDTQYTFCTCYLQKCFYEYAQQFLNKLNTCDKEDIKNRDIIFMSLHVIKYLIDLGRYFEAQELMQKLHKCSGLCKQAKNVNFNTNSCGCSM